ncbi:MAG: glycosyltransferase [Kiritimatiellae bacterium]|nr:glycosyltransferase [Kiritimatiellia bacterium]
MKNVLLYYGFGFSFGGGEPLPLSLISELQDICRLTVAVDVPENVERAADLFGIPVDVSKFAIARVSPPGYNPRKHGALDSFRRSRNLKRLAARADVCISASNVMDFGRPGHHFINMLAFGDDAFSEHVQAPGFAGKPGNPFRRALKEALLRPVLGMRAKRSVIHDPRERIYPNSRFVQGLMEEFYGPFNNDIFYPPTLFDPKPSAVARDPLSVVCIGRIVPEKRITDLVAIVEKARALSGLDIRFRVAGRLDQTPSYGKTLSRMAEERPWLQFPGPLFGRDKEEFLLSGTFAIHAERKEAFGISVSEYLKAGLLPLVPDEGGACEVVDNPALSYHSAGEAARLLARLATNAPFRTAQLSLCATRASFFSLPAYMDRQHRLLERIISHPTPS